MNKTKLATLAIVVFSFTVGAYVYPQMPDMMASHWNYRGEVDGYMPRIWGLFFLPALSVFFVALFFLIPKIDPLRANVEKFRKDFDVFVLMFEIFFFYLYLLTIFWSLGARFDMTSAMLPAMGILFYYVGVMIGKAQRNFFIGIRTPWTLSSDNVWNKTHALGGRLFKGVGIITFLGSFAPTYVIFMIFIPIVSVSVYLVIYSYLEFEKEKKKK